MKHLRIVEPVSVNIGWNKSSVDYAISHKGEIERYLKRFRHIDRYDIDDIYMDLLEYLHRTEDYSLLGDIQTLTLDSFVKACASHCAKRYISKKYTEASKVVSLSSKVEDNSSIIDRVADKTAEVCYELIGVDIDTALKALEYKRYQYGYDLYLLIYLRYLTLGKDSLYAMVCNILLGDINNLGDFRCDPDILTAIKLLSEMETEEVLEHLSNFIYGYEEITTAYSLLARFNWN